MAMNKQMRIKIACILSDIFLLSALHYKDNGEIDINLTKSFYKRITNKILDVSPNFTKEDFDAIFPAIAYYCMHKINLWIFDDDWSSFDKEVMQKELETEWKLNYIFGLFYKHKVRYKYEMICSAFGFTESEAMWDRDREVPSMLHIPLWLIMIGAISLSFLFNIQFGLIALVCVILAWVSIYLF